jgi:sarcosine oxidase subunit beta
MGLSAAYHLRRLDSRAGVAVLERAHVGAAASGASAAGVRVMGRDPAERPLALESLRRWAELDRELDGETGYRRGGGLRLALDETAWRAVPDWVAGQRADGVPVDVVDAAGARRLAPGIAPGCLGAVHCAIDGQAEAMPSVRAFAGAARRLGARIHEDVGVRAVIAEHGRVVAVETTDGGRETCDVAIVTAGLWSGALLAPLGIELPLRGCALQMLLTVPAPPALDPVVGAFDRALSLKQLAGGAYLIGGGWPAHITDEAANGWRVQDESVRGSLGLAREVFPPLEACRLARGWAGLEAFTPDGVPLLGTVPGVAGLLVAAGFCGHGFALAPAVGDVLARLALGLDARADLWRGLRLDRFAGHTTRRAGAPPSR